VPIATVRQNFRLRPGIQALTYLQHNAGCARLVWNHLVDTGIKNYQNWKTTGVSNSWFNKQHNARLNELKLEFPFLKDASSTALQQEVQKYSKAFEQAVASHRPNSKDRKRFPTFHGKRYTRPSLTFTNNAFSLISEQVINSDGRLETKTRLKLQKLKQTIPVVWSQELHSTPSSVTIYQDSIGHWYASFVTTMQIPEETISTDYAIGGDPGIKSTMTTAVIELGELALETGFDLDYQEFAKESASKLARQQKSLTRKRRDVDGGNKTNKKSNTEQSHAYRLDKFKVAKTHKKIKNQRKDAYNKYGKRLAESFDVIAIENLRSKFLGKTKMARKAQDAALTLLIQIILWQAKKRGAKAVLVPPYNTTQECFYCGTKPKCHIELNDRIFHCNHCGITIDRDKNSALNMLKRVGLDPSNVENIRQVLESLRLAV